MRIQVRTHGIQLDEWQEEVVVRRVRFALGRFADHIAKITVWVADEGGMQGEPQHRGLVEVALRSGPKVYAEGSGLEFEMAAANAARKASRRVRDELARRRLFDRRPRALHTIHPLELEEVSR